MQETIKLTEVTDVITPEEETIPENYNFSIESTWKETIYSAGGGSSADTETLKKLFDRSLTSIEIPEGTTAIGDYIFRECRELTSVTIPESVQSIGVYSFAACSKLTEINIPNTIQSFGTSAFGSTGIRSFVIPLGVTSVPGGMFSGCGSLESVTIPSSVTSIGPTAFNQCSSLSQITIFATVPPTLQKNSFYGLYETCPIYVPAESVDAYKSAQYWSERADYIQAISEG